MIKSVYCLLIIIMLLLSCSDKDRKKIDNENNEYNSNIIEDDKYIENIIENSSK